MKNRSLFFLTLLLCPLVPSMIAQAATVPPTFTQLQGFPASPAENAFSVSSAVLGDGRFVLYDGNALLVQDAVEADSFTPIASGYPGDPAILAVAPDGVTCLLGGGVTSSNLYLVSIAAPVDNGDPIASVDGNFSAQYINDHLVLVDRAVLTDPVNFVYAASLGILDLSTSPPTFREVVTGTRGASASVDIDTTRNRAYATDGLTGETRWFNVDDLVNAYQSETPLDWTAGTLLGTYNTFGVFGISNRGTLLIGGSDPTTYAGSVQFVDPDTGEIAGTADPTGNGFTFYSGAYNAITGRVLLVGADFPGPVMSGWLSDTVYEFTKTPPGPAPLPLLYFFLLWFTVFRRFILSFLRVR